MDLKHLTTSDILFTELKRGYITEAQGNTIWTKMLSKQRKLGVANFTAYLQAKQK